MYIFSVSVLMMLTPFLRSNSQDFSGNFLCFRAKNQHQVEVVFYRKSKPADKGAGDTRDRR